VSTNAYNEDAGFLNGFTEAEKAALAPAPIVVDVDGEPTLPDKIYLLSAIDAGAAIGAGEAIPFLADENNRIALPTAEAVSHSNFTDVFLSDTRGWYWWTRTMLFPGGFRIRTINPNGRSGAEYANCGHVGLRPACNLSSNQAVSEEKDSDGAYALE
jgi:hypothetical protein